MLFPCFYKWGMYQYRKGFFPTAFNSSSVLSTMRDFFYHVHSHLFPLLIISSLHSSYSFRLKHQIIFFLPTQPSPSATIDHHTTPSRLHYKPSNPIYANHHASHHLPSSSLQSAARATVPPPAFIHHKSDHLVTAPPSPRTIIQTCS